MSLGDAINGWLPLVGGVTGLVMFVYFGLMVYYNARKSQEIAALRRELGELRGMLLIIAGQLQARKR